MITLYTCPDCKCEFVQPFKCITCGAEKLYDATVKSQAARIAALEAVLRCCLADPRIPTDLWRIIEPALATAETEVKP